jgi:hypothetical protein
MMNIKEISLTIFDEPLAGWQAVWLAGWAGWLAGLAGWLACWLGRLAG